MKPHIQHTYGRNLWLLILLFGATVASAANTNEFLLQITNRLGMSFPADTKVEHVATHVGRAPLGNGTNLTHEWFAVLAMSPTNAQRYRKEIDSVRRNPDSQVLIAIDKERKSYFGWTPGPHQIPEHIKQWWGEVKADTTIYLREHKRIGPNEDSDRGGVMIFLSRESGRLWVWSYEYAKKNS